ncbi:MAG: toprim domain-containing protein [Elusimicrobia bacterium]|nr:toprim domain-containing protein [Elusimicrobiota bacterium]
MPAPPGRGEGKGRSMKLVIVESPSKAKKIRELLGPGYRVAASMGHVRDLPPKGALAVAFKDGKVLPTYELLEKSSRAVSELSARFPRSPRRPRSCCSPPTPLARERPSPGT